jgi:hypothetical protein
MEKKPLLSSTEETEQYDEEQECEQIDREIRKLYREQDILRKQDVPNLKEQYWVALNIRNLVNRLREIHSQ